MDSEKLLRDFKVFCLVTLFYLLLLGVFAAVRAWRGRKNPEMGLPTSLKSALHSLLASKNFLYLYSAVYLFTTIYAVKNVVIRIVLVFIYVAVIAKMVKNDLDSRKN